MPHRVALSPRLRSLLISTASLSDFTSSIWALRGMLVATIPTEERCSTRARGLVMFQIPGFSVYGSGTSACGAADLTCLLSAGGYW